MKKITKDTTLDEILADPKAGEILSKHNVPCLSCPMAKFEIKSLKIGDVCEMYSIDLKKLLEDLNKVYNKK